MLLTVRMLWYALILTVSFDVLQCPSRIFFRPGVCFNGVLLSATYRAALWNSHRPTEVQLWPGISFILALLLVRFHHQASTGWKNVGRCWNWLIGFIGFIAFIGFRYGFRNGFIIQITTCSYFGLFHGKSYSDNVMSKQNLFGKCWEHMVTHGCLKSANLLKYVALSSYFPAFLYIFWRFPYINGHWNAIDIIILRVSNKNLHRTILAGPSQRFRCRLPSMLSLLRTWSLQGVRQAELFLRPHTSLSEPRAGCNML